LSLQSEVVVRSKGYEGLYNTPKIFFIKLSTGYELIDKNGCHTALYRSPHALHFKVRFS
jgi:hypothetical protein